MMPDVAAVQDIDVLFHAVLAEDKVLDLLDDLDLMCIGITEPAVAFKATARIPDPAFGKKVSRLEGFQHLDGFELRSFDPVEFRL